MADTPGELLLLQAAAARLQTITAGADYWFTPDPSSVWIVDVPELKHLGEFTQAFLVHPGDVIYQVDTGCNFLISGDFLVTGARKYQDPELPWQTGHTPLPEVRLKLAQDIAKALNNVELVAELGQRTPIVAFVANRNLTLDADGWAVAQVQFSFSFRDVVEAA